MMVVSLLITLLVTTAQVTALHNISLVVMAPFPGEFSLGWTAGPALKPATIVAAKEINNNTDILPGFHLNLIFSNSGCSDASTAGISFLEYVLQDKACGIAGIVGPGCSGAALRIANLTARYAVSLIHITPSATTPLLEDPKLNLTYATISSALSYVKSFVEIIKHNNWSTIATLQDEERLYFKQTHSRFMATVESEKVIFTGNMFAGQESVIPLDNLRASGARVIIVFAGKEVAFQLMCYAYHRDMLFPNYQWIFHDRNKNNFIANNTGEFRVNGKSYNCTDKEMINATHGIIMNLFHLEQENKEKILPHINRSYNDYYRDYEEELGTEEPNIYGNSYHDAVWAMALALHNASQLDGVDLKTYTYNKNSDTKKVAEHLKRVDFDGMSGPITFQSDTRSVKTIIDVKQLWNGEDLLIGTFDRSNGTVLQINSTTAQFIDGIHNVGRVKIHVAIGIFAIFMTIILIFLVGVLQLANVVWYHHRSIKATSPNIKNLIFSGCYLYAAFLILFSIQQAFEGISILFFSIICNVMVWCILLGYSLIFGTVCATIWRLHRLFKHFRNQSPGIFLSDNILVLCVISLLLIDTSICLAWNLLDPLKLQRLSLPDLSTPLKSEFTHQCNCQYWNFWIGAVVAYKGSIVIPLVILSILNRKIKRKNFQRTRNITILIYTLCMVSGIGIPLYFLLRHESIYLGFWLLFLVIYLTILLCCLTLFLSPVAPVTKKLWKERKAQSTKKIMVKVTSATSVTTMSE